MIYRAINKGPAFVPGLGRVRPGAVYNDAICAKLPHLFEACSPKEVEAASDVGSLPPQEALSVVQQAHQEYDKLREGSSPAEDSEVTTPRFSAEATTAPQIPAKRTLRNRGA